MSDRWSPLYEATVVSTRIDPFSPARHRLHGHDTPTEELYVGDHSDDNGDGVADHTSDVRDREPPDIPADEMTVCVCGES